MNENTIEPKKQTQVSLIALDPVITKDVVAPTEGVRKGRDLVEWGDNNAYPDYLFSLFKDVATLASVINGSRDFAVGNDVTIARPLYGDKMNRAGETIRDLAGACYFDWFTYGGFALQVIRNGMGEVAEVYHTDMRYLRTNKENTIFYYNEDWTKRKDTITYPAYMDNIDWRHLDDNGRKTHSSSILFVKNNVSQVYPMPLYASAVVSCEIERNIDLYHLSSLNNGFSGNTIVNFNNGTPTDEVRREIERNFTKKHTGVANGGRVMLTFNESADNAVTVTSFNAEDFGEKYDALAKRSRSQIFTAFRAIPLLFGLTSEANTGFSTEEFEQSFKLYNRTQILPAQRVFGDAMDRIFGVKGVVTTTPFSLEGATTKVD